ncbi:MAG TPA: hypothetical protein DEF78_11645, partial [Sphingobacterium sp.]|nr:hypothetical protein [Sphingobacterium sp.]
DIYLVNEVKIIRQFLSSSRAIPVKKTDPKIQYLQWSLTDFKANYCGELLSNIAENKYSNNNYHFILINLSESITPCRGKILVFRDSYQNDFPDYFVKIDYLENEIEFDEWLKTNNTKGFNLRNNPAFQKMSSIAVKGAIVYLELKTQRYWHLDTFHDYKEYEVYDSTGKHLATADENGKLNFDGIVLDRFINIK